MKKSVMAFLIGIIIFAFVTGVTNANEQVVVTRDDLMRVAKQIFPPGSNGKTADWCPLPTGFMMREEIVGLLKTGMSDEEVLDELVDKYGEQVLAAPRKKGFNQSLWVLPVSALVLGIIVIIYFLRKRYRRRLEQVKEGKEEKTGATIEVDVEEQIAMEFQQFVSATNQEGSNQINELFRELADLEYDFLMGKLSEGDYASIKKELYQEIAKHKKEGRDNVV
jgi:cytochrome c-type biogenesis protein CcmH